MIIEQQVRILGSSASRCAALVLDASESARGYRREIIGAAQFLLEHLPARIRREIYFLGNPTPYPAVRFATEAGRWFEENGRRASVLAPVLRSLAARGPFRLILLGSGTVFDLEDAGHHLQDACLVSMGEPLQGSFRVVYEHPSPTPQQLLVLVHDPVIRVQVTAPGFMPLFWDNSAYSVATGDGGYALIGEGSGEAQLEVRLRYGASEPDLTEARTVQASGRQASTTIEPWREDFIPRVRAVLTVEEREILLRAIARETFRCRYGGSHQWDELTCTHGPSRSFLGEPVYPSLVPNRSPAMEEEPMGFVLFEIVGDAAYFIRYPCPVLAVRPAQVAIVEGQRAVLHRFEAGSAGWVRDKMMEPYHRLRENCYAVVM